MRPVLILCFSILTGLQWVTQQVLLLLILVQILSTRARKEVALSEVKVPIVVFAFDCLFLNGKSMLHEPLTARREALYQALTPVEGQLMFATTKTSSNVEELEVGGREGEGEGRVSSCLLPPRAAAIYRSTGVGGWPRAP